VNGKHLLIQNFFLALTRKAWASEGAGRPFILGFWNTIFSY